MVRIIGGIIGLGLALVLLIALFGSLTTPATPETAETVFHKHPEHVELASNGVFGKFDRQQLQRGFQVYKEVCAACHSLRHIAFRDLEALGYNEAEVKKIAADWPVKQPTFDEKTGDRGERTNLPADRIPTVYYPGTGTPPDLSLITKARHDGAAYLHALLTGYQDQPAELLKKFPGAKTPDGMYFNPYFANLNIAMPPPLTQDDQVTYTDGTRATKDQMSKDVAAFLVWSAEPNLESRHRAGLAAVLFLLIFCGLAYGAYLTVWRGVKH